MVRTPASIWRSGSSRFDDDAREAGAAAGFSVKADSCSFSIVWHERLPADEAIPASGCARMSS
jgi:hypothetical protein